MPTTWSGGAAAAYDVSFGQLCAGVTPHVLDRLREEPGVRLLDVGAGTGRLSTAAAAAGYSVTAVDPDDAMLEVARSRDPGERLDWVEGGAPVLPFPDSTYDHAVAAFVLNHVPSPRATLRDIARVVAPGGTVTATVWGTDPGEMALLWAAAMAAEGVEPVPPERLPPQEDFARTPDGLAALARECGLDVEAATQVSWPFVIEPVDLWQGPSHGLAGIGRAVLAQSPETRERMATMFFEAAGAVARDGRLHLRSEAVLVVCRRRPEPGASR